MRVSKASSSSASPLKKIRPAPRPYAENGIVQEAIRRIKSRWPELIVVADTCLCEYTSHGHCGLVSPEGVVQKRSDPDTAGRTAVAQAQAGRGHQSPPRT